MDNTVLEARTQHTITDRDALLEEIAKTRRNGFSCDNGEFMDGMAAIAVGIRDDQQRLLTTLSIHAPIQRRSLQSLIEARHEVQAAAHRLEELIEYDGLVDT